MKKNLRPPKITMEADWKSVELPFNIGSGRTIYSGLEKDSRLRLRVFQSRKTGQLVGRAWFGHGADGPPLHAHGGAVAYVLDEAMGAVAWMNCYPALAANLQFRYLRPTPLLQDLTVEAKVISVRKKVLKIEAQLRLPTGEECVVASGDFVRVSLEKKKFFDLEKHDPAGVLKKMKLKWAQEDAR